MSKPPSCRDPPVTQSDPSSAFDGLLPEGAAVVEAHDRHLWMDGLLQEEEGLIVHAAEKRRREFIAGRNCARLALQRLGMAPAAIGIGSFREPLFPAGVSGSITHTQEYCAAAVIRTGAVLSIGIDAESNEPLSQSVADIILNSDEQLMAQAFGNDCCVDMLVFSIKEAFFKAIFPLCRQYLEFSDAIVALSPADHTFSVRVVRADMMARLGRTEILGRYRYDARRVYTAVSLLTSPPLVHADS